MKKNSAPAHPYTLLVAWSDEDQTWIGRCPELFIGGVHGDNRAAVYTELCAAVDEHIALARKDGTLLPEAIANKKFSGKFVFRTTPAHHRSLALEAIAAGHSLNTFVKKRLSAK